MTSRKNLESKLQKQILLSTEIDVSFENFPYYLHHSTKDLLLLSSNLNLKYPTLSKFTSNLNKPSRSILLSGPTGSKTYQKSFVADPIGSALYQETLVKALTKHFGIKLIIVKQEEIEEEKGLVLVKKRSPFLQRVLSGNREVGNSEKDDIRDMFKVACSESRKGPLIVFVKQAEDIVVKKKKVRNVFVEVVRNIPENVVVIVSSVGMNVHGIAYSDDLFTRVNIELPKDVVICEELKLQLDHDVNALKKMSNVVRIRSVLNKIGLDCDDLESSCITDQAQLSTEYLERVGWWALSHHLMNNPNVSDERGTNIVLSCESIKIGFLSLEHTTKKNEEKIKKNTAEKVNVEVTAREHALKQLLKGQVLDHYEEKILGDVVLSDEIEVTFDEVGALDNIKETLKDMVMLPLQRPELFQKGDLMKPCKGILLFGPPGTGKTMMAKALATEAGANFLSISTTTIMSKWVGKGEKFVTAVFSLATKISPCIVFFDEVDSFLGKRRHDDQEYLRSMKNEFMTNWDGMRTNANERVLVLAATNRPYDLDEAVVRRLSRRLMVNLPDAVNRKKILEVILKNEELEPSIDLETIASMTEGYSGSDLKNLCIAAAHYPIKELLDCEKDQKSEALRENRPPPPMYGSENIRPLHMDDFKKAHQQVRASVSTESEDMKELIEWNERYGEDGSRKHEKEKHLSYYI